MTPRRAKPAPDPLEPASLLTARRHATDLVMDELTACTTCGLPAPDVDALLRAAFDVSLELDRVLARLKKKS
jgi:hypothetical protein